MYCWTNGHTVSNSASRTDNLFHIVLDELSHQPPGHRIIAGDLNADTADIPTLQSALDTDQYIDLGASTCFNTDTHIPTCFPPNQ
eukprot:9340549-Karenia_brevis.AAC.1